MTGPPADPVQIIAKAAYAVYQGAAPDWTEEFVPDNETREEALEVAEEAAEALKQAGLLGGSGEAPAGLDPAEANAVLPILDKWLNQYGCQRAQKVVHATKKIRAIATLRGPVGGEAGQPEPRFKHAGDAATSLEEG